MTAIRVMVDEIDAMGWKERPMHPVKIEIHDYHAIDMVREIACAFGPDIVQKGLAAANFPKRG